MDYNNFENFSNNNFDFYEEYEEPKKKRRRRKKKSNNQIGLIILLAFSTVVTFSLCIFLLVSYNNQRNQTLAVMKEVNDLKETNESLYTKEDAEKFMEKGKEDLLKEVKTLVEEGSGMLTLLQHMYPDHVIASSEGKYHFFPISDKLKKNEFDLSKFTYPEENEITGKLEGTAEYQLDEKTKAKKGIDVSTFQGDIDWKKVKEDGMDFVFIRLGFRGYESGKIVLDSKYEDNIAGSIKAGLDTGVYFFTEALTEKEAIEEAEFVIENLKDHPITMPVVIDVEESANTEKTRTKDLTAEQRTKNVIAFCKRIKEAGYEPMIYGNLKSFMIMMDFEKLENYDKWFAYYRFPFHFPYKIKIWQYTSTEKVEGIEGNTDVNIMFY